MHALISYSNSSSMNEVHKCNRIIMRIKEIHESKVRHHSIDILLAPCLRGEIKLSY